MEIVKLLQEDKVTVVVYHAEGQLAVIVDTWLRVLLVLMLSRINWSLSSIVKPISMIKNCSVSARSIRAAEDHQDQKAHKDQEDPLVAEVRKDVKDQKDQLVQEVDQEDKEIKDQMEIRELMETKDKKESKVKLDQKDNKVM